MSPIHYLSVDEEKDVLLTLSLLLSSEAAPQRAGSSIVRRFPSSSDRKVRNDCRLHTDRTSGVLEAERIQYYRSSGPSLCATRVRLLSHAVLRLLHLQIKQHVMITISCKSIEQIARPEISVHGLHVFVL